MRHNGVILGAFLLLLGLLIWRKRQDQQPPISSQWGESDPDNIDYETFRQNMHSRTASMETTQRNRRNAQS